MSLPPFPASSSSSSSTPLLQSEARYFRFGREEGRRLLGNLIELPATRGARPRATPYHYHPLPVPPRRNPAVLLLMKREPRAAPPDFRSRRVIVIAPRLIVPRRRARRAMETAA
jgi:hypothetical protein